MTASSIVHRPNRKPPAELNAKTDRKIKTPIPFGEVKTPVKGGAQDRDVFTRRCVVGLLTRRRTYAIRAGTDK